jgi:hypothetical protein
MATTFSIKYIRKEDLNVALGRIFAHLRFSQGEAISLPSHLRHDIYGMRFRQTIPRLQRHDYVL